MTDLYESMADKQADAFGIPRSLFRALIQTESSWNPFAIGKKGEIGLTQLMPTTATEMGINAWDAEDNLKGGASYLATQFKKFGNWAKALAAYNGGPGGVDNKAAKDYAANVLKTQTDLQKANPQLDQAPAVEQPQDAWHGSVAEQIWNWITGSGDTPIGKSPEPGSPNYDPQNPTLPKPTEEQTNNFASAAGTVGKYAAASIIAIIAIGIALYVLAVRGKDVATEAVKKNVA